MARFSTVFLCIVVLAVGCLAEDPSNQSLKTDIEIVDDISVYLSEHSDVTVIPLDSEIMPFGRLRFTLGGRRVPGDRIVVQANNNVSYPRLQDVRVNLNYPQSGIGAIVSYVNITIDIAVGQVQGYIVGGGIGQRSIRIVIEARRTNRLAYNALIFGY